MATPVKACPAVVRQASALRDKCLRAYKDDPGGGKTRWYAARACAETARLAGELADTKGCELAEVVLRKATAIAGRLGLKVAGAMAKADQDERTPQAGVGQFKCLGGLCGTRRRRTTRSTRT